VAAAITRAVALVFCSDGWKTGCEAFDEVVKNEDPAAAAAPTARLAGSREVEAMDEGAAAA